MAGLLLEIAYTRVISFKLFYYYTYLDHRAGPARRRLRRRARRRVRPAPAAPHRHDPPWGCLIGVASRRASATSSSRSPTSTPSSCGTTASRASFSSLARLLLICLALFAPFAAIGVMIATLFGRRTNQLGRLYFADLLGAGLACAVAVFLIRYIGPPSTIALAGLVLAGTAVRIALRPGSRLLPGRRRACSPR